MGGDHGPNVVVPAALSVLRDVANLKLILVGDQEVLAEELHRNGAAENDRLSTHHASQVVV